MHTIRLHSDLKGSEAPKHLIYTLWLTPTSIDLTHANISVYKLDRMACANTHAHAHTHKQAFNYTHNHWHACSHIHINTHTYICKHTPGNATTHAHTHTDTYTPNTNRHTRTHAHNHTHMYTRTYVHTLTRNMSNYDELDYSLNGFPNATCNNECRHAITSPFG
jgi:hypothetical protein